MSVNCDGGTESIIPDAKSPDLQHGETSFEEENFSPEAFRGFETKPVVLLERYNITPYLNKLKSSFISDDIEQYVSANNPVSMKILQQCRVNLVRDDLLNLKRSLANQSPRSDVSESVADEAMGHLKCKICKKIYSSEKKLLNHQENKHMIVYRPESKPQKRVSFSEHVIIHEVKEYHKCRKCPRIFEDYKSLKVHMKHQHKKRKCYICNYCNKNFVDRMFFKVHIKLHCDVCGLLLPNKAKYIEHRRNVCRVLKLHKCKTCDSSFFKFMDLKDHSYEHISTYFICDICKDQLATKCAVSHHIKFLHSKERPKDHSSASLYTMRNLGTERLYLCNFCDETSVDRDILEYHVQALPDLSNRAMTGYKDYYFCDQCLKKFDTEKDMLQHKWTHFLKTSDNSQERNAEIGTSKIKTTYKVGEKLPKSMQPMLILKKVNIDGGVVSNQEDEDEGLVDVLTVDVMTNGEVKKAIVDPKSKKTIISKHQCQICCKYYSSGYCLNRHITTQHGDYENLRCKVCEETFVWPSLLQSHRCIRISRPEMPFEDARPEIYFDNLQQNNFDDFNITDNEDDYMNAIDFEIPAPIVNLNECEERYIPNDSSNPLQSLGYKVIMQEVPIEF